MICPFGSIDHIGILPVRLELIEQLTGDPTDRKNQGRAGFG
jgi:hypothetical protein